MFPTLKKLFEAIESLTEDIHDFRSILKSITGQLSVYSTQDFQTAPADPRKENKKRPTVR